MGAASHFNPPAPCGAGRAAWLLRDCGSEISIHPPRAGRDAANLSQITTAMDFNPPAPCGAGRIGMGPTISQHRISIHPPRAGRDLLSGVTSPHQGHFNPPAPCGAGRLFKIFLTAIFTFQSTRPVRGGTYVLPIPRPPTRFQSTRPVRGGTWKRPSRITDDLFQSTRPVRGGTAHSIYWCSTSAHFNPPAPCGAGRRRFSASA